MPLYEYECDACGQRFEVIQKFSETTEQCRLCGKGPVRRLVAAPAFQFKGTGWYITDYAQKGKSSESSAESKGSSGEKSDTSTSDGKKDAAAKSESSSPAPTTSASTKD
jgi:putative FmdB family regulatory protein